MSRGVLLNLVLTNKEGLVEKMKTGGIVGGRDPKITESCYCRVWKGPPGANLDLFKDLLRRFLWD